MTVLERPNYSIESAINQLREGKFVLLHDSDSRENEVDIVVAAEFATEEHVRTMRTDAGGLVCVALGDEIGKSVGLPFLQDVLLTASMKHPLLKSLHEENAPYGGKSAFSITVNSKETFTGITDRDRAMTIRRLGQIAKMVVENLETAHNVFASEFKAPGHVHLLLESHDSLAGRCGHTELSVFLCKLAGLAPAAAICEMLDGRSHNALSTDDARRYAQSHTLPILDGQQLIAEFNKQAS
jgi:3,4-dihydroxy 2-butanone 4-phosphate synthase